MESLVTVGWLRPEPQANYARSPTAWTVNPAVHTAFAETAAQERKAREEARASIAEAAARIRGERR
jgi:hypothetical protein